MKKTVLLLAIFFILFLFCSCSTVFSILYGSTKYYEYDFVNKKNKNVIRRGKRELYSPEIIIDGVKFFFGFTINGELLYGKDGVGGSYSPWIMIRALEGKLIDHVLINRVVIYAGETEYSMLERVRWVSLSLVKEIFSLTEEEKYDVRCTGLIDHTIYTDDEYTYINTCGVYIDFNSVHIDFTKYKEIKMLFDISVEYTTGEIITINQELIGLLKMKRVPHYDYIWFPTV
jgi:hypothetical protein